MPSTPHPQRPGRRRSASPSGRLRARARSRLCAVLATVALALALGGCSGDDERSGEPSPPDSSPTEKTLPQGNTRSVVQVGQVAGSLSKRDRKRVVADVGDLVDRWFQRAWLAAPLGKDAQPFPGFTPAAQRKARAEREVTTARAIDRPLGGVVPRTRGVRLDVLAPGGRPEAVTARVHLGLAAYDRELERLDGRVVVSGRLMIAPVGKDWKVFGYDLATSTPWKKARDRKEARR